MYQLLPLERRIWERFRSAPPWPIDSERFSVRLGEGQIIPPGTPDWLARDIKALTQKRADVIVQSGLTTWIIEIKPRAGFSALGQLLGYGLLYVAEYDPPRPPNLAVVAETTQPDLAAALGNFSIQLYLVGRS
jgi:hypothetical protein